MRRCLRCLAQEVTPWGVSGAAADAPLRYDKVVQQFGSEMITPETLSELEGTLGSPLHRFFRRGIAFSHRDLIAALQALRGGRRTFLYTGRGPSDKAMHLGHTLPFLLTQHLQEKLRLPLVIQLTDDEKYLFRDLDMEKLRVMTRENIKDILSFGFDLDRTFVFNNLSYMNRLYPNTLRIQRHLTFNKVAATFGFNESTNVGCLAFPAIQAAPCLSSSFPVVLPAKGKMQCLIPCAIDQDPFFLLTRDICPKLKYPKPSVLLTKFLPPLTGVGGKMSSSGDSKGLVLLTDDRKTVEKKMRSAFSGGAATMEEFRERGGRPEVDIAFQYLFHFLDDDAELAALESEYRKGTISTGAMKSRAAEVVWEFLDRLQTRRRALTDEDVDRVMTERSILLD